MRKHNFNLRKKLLYGGLSALIATAGSLGVGMSLFNGYLKYSNSSKLEQLRKSNFEKDFAISIGDQVKEGKRKIVNDTRLVTAPVPNSKGYVAGFPYSINEHGFRDKSYFINKSVNTFRIGVLGDSFTMGFGLPDPLTLCPQILEDMLNFVPNNTKRYEVLNFGISGYNTLAELAVFERVSNFGLDLAILQFLENDLEIIEGQSPGLKTNLQQFFNNKLGENFLSWRIFLDSLQQIKSISDKKDIDFYFSSQYFPDYFRFNRRHSINEKANNLAKNFGIGVIDHYDSLKDLFIKYNQNETFFLEICQGDSERGIKRNNHPSVIYNESVALNLLSGILPSLPAEDSQNIRDFYFERGFRKQDF